MAVPVVTCGADQSKTYSGSPQAIALTATATGSPTSYAWTMKSVPLGSAADVGVNGDFTDGASSVQNPSFNIDANVSGSYVCECIATNGEGDSNPDIDRDSCQTIVTVGTEFADKAVPGDYQFSYGTMLVALLNHLINKKLDELNVPSDNENLNASPTAHGLQKKLSNIATEYMNGIGGYTVPAGAAHLLGSSQHTIDTLTNLNAKISGGDLDFTTASRTPTAHTASHQSGGGDSIKLDDLASPDDNTDLDVTNAAHGLMKKLSNVATELFNGVGAWVDYTPSNGGISVYGNTNSTSISVLNDWYQVTNFDTNEVSSGDVTPDHTNDHLTIGADGNYRISFNASFSGQASSAYEVAVFKNNGATLIDSIATERKLGAGGDIGVIAASGIVSLSENDTIELWVRDTTSPVGDLTFKHVSLSAFAIAAVGASAGGGGASDFIDPLDDDSLDATWTVNVPTGGSVTEQNGRLEIDLPSGTTLDWYGSNFNAPNIYMGIAPYDFSAKVYVKNVGLTDIVAGGICIYEVGTKAKFIRVAQCHISTALRVSSLWNTSNEQQITIGQDGMWVGLIRRGNVFIFYYSTNAIGNEPELNDMTFWRSTSNPIDYSPNRLALYGVTAGANPATTIHFNHFSLRYP